MKRLLVLAWLVGVLFTLPSRAHKPSDSYLTLAVAQDRIDGRWDIALRDLEFALGLDADGDGAITWGELRQRHAAIAAYALARLRIESGDGSACALEAGEQRVDEHTDGAYTVLAFRASCATVPAELTLEYRLFAEIDPQHRGLLNLRALGATRTAVLGPHAPRQTFSLGRSEGAAQFTGYFIQGVRHIWIGIDHVLFLLSLLLPAVLLWRAGGWRPAGSFRESFWDVFRIVTAFTVAHSITLSLAALGLVWLPSRWVESAIAASVLLAALNNVFPLVHRRRWAVAFVFGLIHGFGFASVLADLGLPQDALALALVGFNVGVEAGQLVIVAAFLPLAYWLRGRWIYRRVVLVGGSALIAALAAVWLVERVWEVTLLAF